MKTEFRFKKTEIGKFCASSDEAVENFQKDWQIVGLTIGRWSLIDLIYSTLKKTGPADVYIATWSAGIKDAHQVRWMRDEKLITRIALLTDCSFVNRQNKYAMSIEQLFGRENIRTSDIHAKFVLIRNAEFDITILSSMNLNANRKCENFTIIEDLQVAEFHQDFIDHHFKDLGDGWETSSRRVELCVKNFFEELEKEGKKPKAPKAEKSKRGVGATHWSLM